jgi:hypothetical protein
MPNQPDQTEEMLQAYARRRREDAGEAPVLHPATRKLLQAEVARTLAPARTSTENTAGVPWLALFVRLAFGGALVIVVLVAPFLHQTKSKQEFASFSRDEQAARLSATPAEQGAAPSQPDTSDDRKASQTARELDIVRSRALAERAETAGAPAVSSPTPPAAPLPGQPPLAPLVDSISLEARTGLAGVVDPQKQGINKKLDADKYADELKRTDAEAKSGPTAATSIAVASPRGKDMTKLAEEATKETVLAKTEQVKVAPVSQDGGGALAFRAKSQAAANWQENAIRQQYTQNDARANLRRNPNSPAVPNVLNSFQVEYDDSRIRITDADGSVYEGQIVGNAPANTAGMKDAQAQQAPRAAAVSPAPAKARAAAEAAGRPIARTPAPAAGEGFSFEVSGTNRTLKQAVVFSGNLAAEPASQQAGERTGGFAGGGGRAYQLNAPPIQSNRPGAYLNQQAQTPSQSNQMQVGQQLYLNQNMRLRGRAVINGRDQYDVDAVPATP